jgi:tetratricopeptide (TPR) repeat protein
MTATATSVDRTALEEERDFLLRSIEDLDAEHAAGDVDDADYEVLKADYTARAADVLRAIEGRRRAMIEARRPRSALRVTGWVALVVVVASLAGWLLARSVGNRSESTGLTGSGATTRGRLSECQPLAFREPGKAIDCYDSILEDEPDNVEALTYRGWARVRSGDPDAGSADFDRVVSIDPEYPDVRVFRAVVAKDAKDFRGAQSELDTLYSLNPSQSLLLTMQDMGLDTEVAFGLLDPRVQRCWLDSQKFLRDVASSSTTVPPGQPPQGTDAQLACFDAVIAAAPDQVDALQARAAFVYRALARDEAPSALAGLDHALAVAPGDPTSLLLRAVLRFATGDTDGAIADLRALEGTGERPSALYQAEAKELQATLSGMAGSGSTTTTPR